jgi:hypothetical protein
MGINEGPARKGRHCPKQMAVDWELWRLDTWKEARGLSVHPVGGGIPRMADMNFGLYVYD